jgi:hypothetical protein
LINTEGPGEDFFADKMTWKLLDKKGTKVELDFDNGIEGIYTGQTRNTIQTLDIKSIENGITRQTIGKERLTPQKHISETYVDGRNNKINYKITSIASIKYGLLHL